MEDKLQNLADRFCRFFNFIPVKVPFFVISRELMNIYKFLFSSESGFWKHKEKTKFDNELEEAEKLGKVALIAAKRGILWRYILEKREDWAVGGMGIDDVRQLEAAIALAERNIGPDEKVIRRRYGQDVDFPHALRMAQRIAKFHYEGKAIREFKELKEFLQKELQHDGTIIKKLPLIKGDRYFEKYAHEVIHFILAANNIDTGESDESHERFNEGLCTYLHQRFRGWWHTFWMYRRHRYVPYARFFEKELDTKSPGEIGPFLMARCREVFALSKLYFSASASAA